MVSLKYLSVILDSDEKLLVEELFKEKWINYLAEWQGEENTEAWNKRKGNSTQWLGYENHHAFFDLTIELLPKYHNGEELYQIDYFECSEFDIPRFQYAANSSKRKLLPNNEVLTYETFYEFIKDILEECIKDIENG